MNLPAFPFVYAIPSGSSMPDGSVTHQDQQFVFTGMDLRDWFAGQALAAQIARGQIGGPSELALRAYRYADEMMRARGDQGDEGE